LDSQPHTRSGACIGHSPAWFDAPHAEPEGTIMSSAAASSPAQVPVDAELSCTIAIHSDAPRCSAITVRGELDLACADALRTTIREVRRAGTRYLRIDLSGVTFLDATILGVLVEAHRDFLDRRGTLVLAGVAGRVARLLSLTRLDRELLIAGQRPHTGRLSSGQVRMLRPDGARGAARARR